MSGLVSVSVSSLELVYECLRLAGLEAVKKIRMYQFDRNDEIYKYFYDEAVCNKNCLEEASSYIDSLIHEARKN